MVSRVKGRDGRDDNDDEDGGLETAICLLTGAVMRSGKRRMRDVRAPAMNSFLHAAHHCVSYHCLSTCPQESISRNMHSSCEESRFWIRYIFPRSKMHHPLDE